MTLVTPKTLKRNNAKAPAKGVAKKPAVGPAKAAAKPAPAVAGDELQVHQIESLTVDPDLQQRAGGVDKKTVKEYAADLLDGVKLPPIHAIDIVDGDMAGALLVWDGFQRIEANTEAGISDIAVLVRKGTYEDAVWMSCSANKSHGLRRSAEDKRKSVTSALMLERTHKMSDRQIAEHCGASPSTVGAIRKELVEAGTIKAVEERVTSTGQVIKTSAATTAQKSAAGKKSGASRAIPPKPTAADDEPVDDSEVAEGLGVSNGSTPAPKPAAVTADVTDGIMLDASDNSVPEELHEVFKQIEHFHRMKRVLDTLAGQLRGFAAMPAGAFLDPANADLLEGIAEEVMAATPYLVKPELKLGWEPTHPDKITFNPESLEPKKVKAKK